MTLPARGPGRPKGSPNKITGDIKKMLLAALDAKGGQKYLERQAEENPTAFMTLLGKVIPTQLSGDDAGGPVKLEVTWLTATPSGS
jgi:hypothetical protein